MEIADWGEPDASAPAPARGLFPGLYGSAMTRALVRQALGLIVGTAQLGESVQAGTAGQCQPPNRVAAAAPAVSTSRAGIKVTTAMTRAATVMTKPRLPPTPLSSCSAGSSKYMILTMRR